MRDRYLNGAQGFAIVAVVCGHVLRTTMDAGFVPDGPVAHLLNVLGYAVNAFGFPLFFFVFGLQATASLKHSRLGFLWTTLNTLVYPYVLWSVLQTLVLWTVAQYEGHPFPLSELQRIAWEPVGQFGFLYALCLCHVFAWGSDRDGHRRWPVRRVTHEPGADRAAGNRLRRARDCDGLGHADVDFPWPGVLHVRRVAGPVDEQLDRAFCEALRAGGRGNRLRGGDRHGTPCCPIS